MITEPLMHLGEAPYSITVRFSADPVTAARLIRRISRLLQKESVSGANISGSNQVASSAAGESSMAK